MKKLLFIPLIAGVFLLTGCSGISATPPSTVTQEQDKTEENQQRPLKAQPPVHLIGHWKEKTSINGQLCGMMRIKSHTFTW
jgi:PBP1b-binding outer membrane lipoprotein LpoB